jgi:hypothetical protein
MQSDLQSRISDTLETEDGNDAESVEELREQIPEYQTVEEVKEAYLDGEIGDVELEEWLDEVMDVGEEKEHERLLEP